MPINPQIEVLLASYAQFPAIDYGAISADQLRALNDQQMGQGTAPEVAHVEDLGVELQGRVLRARLYRPHNSTDRSGLTLFFHGGGWVIGTLDTHDTLCRALAHASGNAVLSLAYRLAPENRYPAAIEDCYDALVWACRHGANLGIDASRLAVAGDSAGGNLAAAVAIAARDRQGPDLCHQLLAYPVVDRDYAYNSYAENGGGEFFLSIAAMEWFWGHYLGETPIEAAPLAAVMRTPDLANLPPATIFTAEFDPLRDEGMAYAAKMLEAGNKVEAAIAPGMIHGFFSMFEAVPDAMQWISRAGQRLKEALT